jgi:hypothetical protein
MTIAYLYGIRHFEGLESKAGFLSLKPNKS